MIDRGDLHVGVVVGGGCAHGAPAGRFHSSAARAGFADSIQDAALLREGLAGPRNVLEEDRRPLDVPRFRHRRGPG